TVQSAAAAGHGRARQSVREESEDAQLAQIELTQIEAPADRAASAGRDASAQPQLAVARRGGEPAREFSGEHSDQRGRAPEAIQADRVRASARSDAHALELVAWGKEGE